jgi:pimeloyl-ACP methyl ester carboxylesterase
VIARVHGIDLACDVRGEGEPLLLLHGFMGAASDWQHVFPSDPPGFRLIAPDLRGHGRSTNPAGEFTFRQAARDVVALLDELGVDRVKAIGLSGGGIALLHIATHAPSRVEAMVVVSAPPYFPAQARAIQAQFSEEALPETERAAMRRRHVHGEAQIGALLAQSRRFSVNHDDVAFTPASLSAITARTLIVFGDRDFLYPVSIAMELYSGIANAHLWIVPNGGHGPIFGAAAPAFVATSIAFLNESW